MNRSIFEVTGPDGLVRRGVLMQPVAGHRIHTAIVLLPAGLKYHVGPSRLNALLAGALARAGYAVLFRSGWNRRKRRQPWGPALVRELWRGVEQGLFVDDTLLAVRELRARLGFESIVVGGLCGGAVQARHHLSAQASGAIGVGADLAMRGRTRGYSRHGVGGNEIASAPAA